MVKILRTRGASEYVGLRESTLEKLRLIGGGPPFIRLGARAIGYSIEDLDRWLDGRRARSTSEARPESVR